MRLSTLALAAAVVVSAGSAHAASMLVAGFDFSQFEVGFLTTDGFTSVANTLPANYSDLDDVDIPGLGEGSQQYGTMYLNGQFGSLTTPGDYATDPFLPNTPNIDQNVNKAVVAGLPMGSAAAGNSILFGEFPASQDIFNSNSMQALGIQGEASTVLDVVFGANLGALVGGDWEIAFGGQVLGAGGTSSVTVEFSPDGVTPYVSIGTADLTSAAAAFSFMAPAAAQNLAEAFFRLRFNSNFVSPPSIDNVTLSANVVPEPGTLVLMTLGLAGLAAKGRRRSA